MLLPLKEFMKALKITHFELLLHVEKSTVNKNFKKSKNLVHYYGIEERLWLLLFLFNI